jgi:hypothetical protein
MKTFQSAHLGTGDIARIKKLSDGIFDDTVLYRLLALLTVQSTEACKGATPPVYVM